MIIWLSRVGLILSIISLVLTARDGDLLIASITAILWGVFVCLPLAKMAFFSSSKN